MSRPSLAPSPLWAQRYEAVRRQAVDGEAATGWGLALIARQGMAAWMRAGPPNTSAPPPPLPSAVTDTPSSFPSDLAGQITWIMADMILAHRQQEIPT